ncbi:MAG: BatD family protein [Myxococcota bacterium]|nr:BatD family protein [Myxococcota bacterium]
MTLLLLIAAALAASLRIEVPATELMVGRTISIEVQLSGAATNDQPVLSVDEGLRLQFAGTSRSVSQVNMRRTEVLRYQYSLVAVAEGEWTVGPASLEVGGQVLVAPPVTVTVVPRASGEQAADVIGTYSDRSPYVGEVGVFQFEYRRRGQVLEARWTPPAFPGFAESREAETQQREYAVLEDGVRVSVQEVYVPLIAMQPGPQTIGPALLTVQLPDPDSRRRRQSIFGFSGGTIQETYATQPIDVAIRPLPTEGRPEGFSGLVGAMKLSVRVSEERIRMGESVTLEVRIASTGALAGMTLPMPEQDGFRVYDDAAEFSANVSEGRYRSVAVFRRALVPEQAGALVVPPVELTVFNPDEERYVTLRSDPIALDVLDGESGMGEITSFSEGDGSRPIAELSADILPPSGSVTVRDHRLYAVLPLLLSAPGAALLGLVGLWGYRRRPREAPGATLTEQLSALPTAPTARLAAVEDIFRQAAAQRLSTDAPGLTREDVAALGAAAEALYTDLSRARYGGDIDAALEARVRRFVEGAEA